MINEQLCLRWITTLLSRIRRSREERGTVSVMCSAPALPAYLPVSFTCLPLITTALMPFLHTWTHTCSWWHHKAAAGLAWTLRLPSPRRYELSRPSSCSFLPLFCRSTGGAHRAIRYDRCTSTQLLMHVALLHPCAPPQPALAVS